VIGILGGGQLGRMLALAAAKLGFDVHIYTDEADSPAGRVASACTVAAYDDDAALAAFAATVDVVTTEFENIPSTTLNRLISLGAVMRPSPKAIAIAQDRVDEKTFFNAHGVATAPFAAVDSRADLAAALAKIGAPAILKTRRLGYDGKGQAPIATPADADAAFAAMAGASALLEGLVAFACETSVVLARSANGAVAAFDLCENEHRNGILHRTIAPARIAPDIAARAQAAASTVAAALDYVGVLAVEFFITPEGGVIANEMAPRVHNSGHWTVEACLTGQFEQHIRAVAGWRLGPTTRLADAEMLNLIGADTASWADLAAELAARLTLYGKREARPGRKMGHVTRLRPLGSMGSS
jgi:5-(carboxyamino)imidazole ribonucleotide synthase